jgi:TrmH family RNA methyltransferase
LPSSWSWHRSSVGSWPTACSKARAKKSVKAAPGTDLITSRTNPLIKKIRSLRDGRARADAGLFLVEGIHPVLEALAAGWEIEELVYAPETLRSQRALDMLSGFAGRKERVTASVFEAVAAKDNPQGILAVVRKAHRSLTDVAGVSRAVALDAPQDPGNLGTILRTLDAVGGDALFVLDGGVDPFHPVVPRASMGALFWIPVVTAGFSELSSWRKAHQCQLVGTSARGGIDYRRFAPTLPWILLLGSEQKGLSDEKKAQCDVVLTLPMAGRASSLNLSVAAGILLYRLAG